MKKRERERTDEACIEYGIGFAKDVKFAMRVQGLGSAVCSYIFRERSLAFRFQVLGLSFGASATKQFYGNGLHYIVLL